MNLVLLAGSPSANSRSTRLLQHVGDRLASCGFAPQLLQVRDLPAAALLHADFGDTGIRAACDAIAQADALVIATPIYQASYSGVLKAFLDLLPQTALTGKPVLPLAVGGSQSHMLAIDYALRPVLAALGSPHILPGIYAAESQIRVRGESSPISGLILEASIAERVANGIGQLAASLRHPTFEPAPALLRLA
jgi:FMN reductase